jgi:hypothetical protein
VNQYLGTALHANRKFLTPPEATEFQSVKPFSEYRRTTIFFTIYNSFLFLQMQPICVSPRVKIAVGMKNHTFWCNATHPRLRNLRIFDGLILDMHNLQLRWSTT